MVSGVHGSVLSPDKNVFFPGGSTILVEVGGQLLFGWEKQVADVNV